MSAAYLELLKKPLADLRKNLQLVFSLPVDDPSADPLSGFDTQGINKDLLPALAQDRLTDAILDVDAVLAFDETEIRSSLGLESKSASESLTLINVINHTLGYRNFKTFTHLLDLLNAEGGIQTKEALEISKTIDILQQNVPEFDPETVASLPESNNKSFVERKRTIQTIQSEMAQLTNQTPQKDLSSSASFLKFLNEYALIDEIEDNLFALDDLQAIQSFSKISVSPQKQARLQTTRLLTPFAGLQAHRIAQEIDRRVLKGQSTQEILPIISGMIFVKETSILANIIDTHQDVAANGYGLTPETDSMIGQLTQNLTVLQQRYPEYLEFRTKDKCDGLALNEQGKVLLAAHYHEYLEAPQSYSNTEGKLLEKIAAEVVLGTKEPENSAHFLKKNALIGYLAAKENQGKKLPKVFEHRKDEFKENSLKWIKNHDQFSLMLKQFPKLREDLTRYKARLGNVSSRPPKSKRLPGQKPTL